MIKAMSHEASVEKGRNGGRASKKSASPRAPQRTVATGGEGRPIAPAPKGHEVSRQNAAEAKGSAATSHPRDPSGLKKYSQLGARQGKGTTMTGKEFRRSKVDERQGHAQRNARNTKHAREPELTGRSPRQQERSKQVQRGEQRIGAGPRAQQPRSEARPSPRLIPQQAEPQGEEPRPRAPRKRPAKQKGAPTAPSISPVQPGRSRPARGKGGGSYDSPRRTKHKLRESGRSSLSDEQASSSQMADGVAESQAPARPWGGEAVSS